MGSDPLQLGEGVGETETPWSVTLKFNSTGAVDVKGEFTVKDAKGNAVVYKPSGSAALIPTTEPVEATGAFAGKVYVYLAPNAKKNFEGFTGTVSVTWDGAKFDFIKE